MTDKRSKPTKPRTKRANSGIKETYHRKTSRQATKQPEAHANAKNRQQTIFTAETSQKAPEPRKVRRMKRKRKRFKKKKAGSYLLSREEQYHRRKRAWLPCSEWERVLPLHCGHRHFMPCCSASIRSGTAMCPGPDVRFLSVKVSDWKKHFPVARETCKILWIETIIWSSLTTY